MTWCCEHLPAAHRLSSWFSGAASDPPVLEGVPSVLKIEAPEWSTLRNPGVEDSVDLNPAPLFGIPHVRLVITSVPPAVHSYSVFRFACFSPNGQTLATCDERHATIYDVATGTETA